MSDRKYNFKVDVPRTEPGAFNPQRTISSLIASQIRHLREIESKLPRERQTNIDVSQIRTEQEAGEYIGKVTALFHRSKDKA